MEKKVTAIIAILREIKITKGSGEHENEGEITYTGDLPRGIKAIKKEHWCRFSEHPHNQFIIEFCDPIDCDELNLFCSQNNSCFRKAKAKDDFYQFEVEIYTDNQPSKEYMEAWKTFNYEKIRELKEWPKSIGILGFGDNSLLALGDDGDCVYSVAEFVDKYFEWISKNQDIRRSTSNIK